MSSKEVSTNLACAFTDYHRHSGLPSRRGRVAAMSLHYHLAASWSHGRLNPRNHALRAISLCSSPRHLATANFSLSRHPYLSPCPATLHSLHLPLFLSRRPGLSHTGQCTSQNAFGVENSSSLIVMEVISAVIEISPEELRDKFLSVRATSSATTTRRADGSHA